MVYVQTTSVLHYPLPSPDYHRQLYQLQVARGPLGTARKPLMFFIGGDPPPEQGRVRAEAECGARGGVCPGGR